jgi:hypothetical protein
MQQKHDMKCVLSAPSPCGSRARGSSLKTDDRSPLPRRKKLVITFFGLLLFIEGSQYYI